MLSDSYSLKKPAPGMPTQYQDTAQYQPKAEYQDLSQFQDQGGLKDGAPASYSGMWHFDQMLQQRRGGEARRQMLAQLLATPQLGCSTVR
jgi:hypothetical protein